MNCKHDYSILNDMANEVRDKVRVCGKTFYPEIVPPRGTIFLGSGIERMGFLLPCNQHVLKVSYNDNWQTTNEVETWQEALEDTELRANLCPVLMWDKHMWWELMDYAPELGFYPSKRQEMEHMSLESFLNLEYNIGDLHGGNVGYLNGRLIAIDYGIPHIGVIPSLALTSNSLKMARTQ